MKSCLSPMMWIALLLVAQPARGQGAPAAGSITVLSRPAGAAVRLAGEQVVVGRTPITIQHGLVGRYELRTLEPDYGTVKRTLFLDGISADTVWITLHPRSAGGAGLRSLVMAGWGQGYGHHPGRGVAFFCVALAAGAGVTVTEVRYRHRLDALRDAVPSYQAEASKRADDARKLRQIAIGTLAGVWGLNVIEAMVHFPSVPSDRMYLSIVPPDPGSHSVPMAALTLRF
jgi:hypothetical protein